MALNYVGIELNPIFTQAIKDCGLLFLCAASSMTILSGFYINRKKLSLENWQEVCAWSICIDKCLLLAWGARSAFTTIHFFYIIESQVRPVDWSIYKHEFPPFLHPISYFYSLLFLSLCIFVSHVIRKKGGADDTISIVFVMPIFITVVLDWLNLILMKLPVPWWYSL